MYREPPQLMAMQLHTGTTISATNPTTNHEGAPSGSGASVGDAHIAGGNPGDSPGSAA